MNLKYSCYFSPFGILKFRNRLQSSHNPKTIVTIVLTIHRYKMLVEIDLRSGTLRNSGNLNVLPKLANPCGQDIKHVFATD